MISRRSLLVLSSCFILISCDGDPAAPRAGDMLQIEFANLAGIPVDVGHFETWVHNGRDTVSVGRMAPVEGALEPLRFEMPLDNATGAFVTIEPPSDADDRPSRAIILAGPFEAGSAQLVIEGALTDGRPLEDAPGAHSLFTTSNNVELGYPSYENAGLWLFTVVPARNRHGTREVKLTPLRSAWVYEGWIVKQTEPEVWISYGKFRPDELSLLRSRDDSGAGPFSGDEDFRNAGVEDVPGEEWTTARVAAQIGITLPPALALPLALDAVDAQGNALWHHVITIEPAYDETEGPLEGRPFVVRPYENAIGPGGPGDPRTIDFNPALPRASIRNASA
jgi:hypothetical protein